jgi:hypothetical protein
MEMAFMETDYSFRLLEATTHLLSPPLSSIPNGGEGDDALRSSSHHRVIVVVSFRPPRFLVPADHTRHAGVARPAIGPGSQAADVLVHRARQRNRFAQRR